MRYQVTLDNDGYCLLIKHTNNPRLDIYELDLSKYDLTNDRLFAYKLGTNELIFDSTRYEQIQYNKQKALDMKEMADLQIKLDDSDYIMDQTTENLLDCTTLVQFIKVFAEIKKKYNEKIANRKTWRTRIQEIKAKYDI